MVPNRDTLANREWISHVRVEHRAILDVGAGTDFNALVVTAEGGTEPDTDVGPKPDAANHVGVWCDPDLLRVRKLGSDSIKAVDRHNSVPSETFLRLPAAITLPGYSLELSCHLLDGRCPGSRCYSFDIAKGECIFVSGVAAQDGIHASLVEFSLPAGHHDRGDTVSDHIHQRPGLAHEAINAKDQSHPG